MLHAVLHIKPMTTHVDKPLTIGQWLRSHRRKLKLTQSQAAERAGYSRAQWGKFENDQLPVPRSAIPAVAAAVAADLSETYRHAGFVPPDDIAPSDVAQLLGYYRALPPICKYDMLTLAKQLHDNHVRFARRAARLSSQAAHTTPDAPTDDWVMIATPFGALLAPPHWQEDPNIREVIERFRQGSGSRDTVEQKRSA